MSSLVWYHLQWGWGCENWRFNGTNGQALIHGRMKDTMSTIREMDRGNDKSTRRRGRENDDGNRDISTLLSPMWWTSCALSCSWMFGRQMTSGRTCDMLSCRTHKNKEEAVTLWKGWLEYLLACLLNWFDAEPRKSPAWHWRFWDKSNDLGT